MKISNRDKKIILIVIILVVVALPYLFLIKPTNEKRVAVEGEIATLMERYNYLNELNQQRDFYISETARYETERADIIKDFAPGIRQENVIMFLRGLELDIPVKMITLSFSGNAVTPIAAGTIDENGNVVGEINGVKTQTSVAYNCKYEEIKEFVARIMENDERMVVSSLTMTYDDETGKIDGMFVLDQFAITGDGRVLPPAEIPEMDHGNESIFGTYISDPELWEKIQELEEAEA